MEKYLVLWKYKLGYSYIAASESFASVLRTNPVGRNEIGAVGCWRIKL